MQFAIKRRNRHLEFLALILVVHLGLLVHTIATYSPTVDEVAHLPAGLSHWRFGRFDLYRVNPPLVEMVAAVPLLFSDFKEDWSGYSIDKLQTHLPDLVWRAAGDVADLVLALPHGERAAFRSRMSTNVVDPPARHLCNESRVLV